MSQEIVQQLRPEKSDFEHTRVQKKKKKEKKTKNPKTLNPEDRTPPFRLLTCLIWYFKDLREQVRTRSPTTRVGHAGCMWGQPRSSEVVLLWRGALGWRLSHVGAAQSPWSGLSGVLSSEIFIKPSDSLHFWFRKRNLRCRDPQ